MIEEENYRIQHPKDLAGLPSEVDEYGDRLNPDDSVLDLSAEDVEAALQEEF